MKKILVILLLTLSISTFALEEADLLCISYDSSSANVLMESVSRRITKIFFIVNL